MLSKVFLPFCVVLIGTTSYGRAQIILKPADYKESCIQLPCNEDKNLVCNRNYFCECRIDVITHAPWIYIDKMEKCIPVLRDADPGIHASPQHHGGNNPGGGWGNSPACISLNTHCTYSTTCQSTFGNLATCKLHAYDSSHNRCACCHPTQETGYYNNRCYFVKRIGEACDTDAECILGSSNSQCKRGTCSFGNQGGNHGGNQGGNQGGHHGGNWGHNAGFGTSGFISISLIIAAGFFALSY